MIKERDDAIQRLRAAGRDEAKFTFAMEHLPPDPDGAGMFTAMYEVTITNLDTAKSIGVIGGIGMRWVDAFEGALKDGDFD